MASAQEITSLSSCSTKDGPLAWTQSKVLNFYLNAVLKLKLFLKRCLKHAWRLIRGLSTLWRTELFTVCNIIIQGGVEPSWNGWDGTSTLQPPEPAVHYPWQGSRYSFMPCPIGSGCPQHLHPPASFPLHSRRISATGIQLGKLLRTYFIPSNFCSSVTLEDTLFCNNFI